MSNVNPMSPVAIQKPRSSWAGVVCRNSLRAKNPNRKPIRAILLLFLLGMFFPAPVGFAQGLIFSNPRPTLLDANGAVLNGAKLCTYQAGTTTPLNTYSDSGLSVANTNPLVTNAAGRLTSSSTEVTVYLLKQSYKFVLLTAGSDGTCATGTTLWTADNQPGGYDGSVILAGTIGTAQLATGTPAVNKFVRGDGAWAAITNIVTTTSTGAQNNFAPGLVSGAVNLIRCNNASELDLTGLSSSSIADGTIVIFESINAVVTFAHQSGSSSAANQFFNFATSGPTPILKGAAVYRYDVTSTYWRLLQHVQGQYITRTFAAGNYTASTGTWTVASATRDAYYLAGRMLTISEVVAGTTSGTPTQVKVALPGTYTAAAAESSVIAIANNGGGTASAGFWSTAAAGTVVNYNLVSGNFAAGTVSIDAVTTFEIQ